MDQNLYIQRYHQPAKKEQSFFSCFNCFPEPQYAQYIVTHKPIIQNNSNNNYLYPSTITQEDRRLSTNSSPQSQLIQSRKSMNTNENKKDAISLRKSRKSIKTSRQTIHVPQRPDFPDFLTIEEVKGVHPSLLLQRPSANLPTNRLSQPQSVITNAPKQAFQNSNRMMSSRPSVAFSYQRQPQPAQLLQNSRHIQCKQNQNVVNNITYHPTDSFLKNSEINSNIQKLSEIYPNKQVLQSLEFEKKISNGSNQFNKIKKSSFGDGKLRFQVRQTVSIREPEQEEIGQSIVIQSSRFPRNNLLKPINESQLQLQSFIDNNHLRR